MSGRLADISRTASFFEVVVINGDLTSKVVVTVGVRVIALVFNCFNWSCEGPLSHRGPRGLQWRE
jgi:hypothetical protein